MPYTEKNLITRYLVQSLDSSYDNQLDMYIQAMSNYMDEMAGYPLVRSEVSTHRYDGTGTRDLIIDPVRDIESIIIDGETATPLEYPANRDDKHELFWHDRPFPKGMQNVEVTGIHARFSEVPSDIQFACTVLVAGILNNIQSEKRGVQSEKLYNYSVTYTTKQEMQDYKQAMKIIDSYKQYAF